MKIVGTKLKKIGIVVIGFLMAIMAIYSNIPCWKIVFVLGMSSFYGIMAATLYPSDIRSQLHLNCQRFIYFILHFVCMLGGWIALYLLLLHKNDWNTFIEHPAWPIFLGIVTLYGITGQLAAFVYYSSKIPESLIAKLK